MATLHGFSLKKIVEYRGHEGEPLAQADVYYNGKQIGFWRQGDFGGEDEFHGVDSYMIEQKYFDIIRDVWEETFVGMFPNRINPRYSDESISADFLGTLLQIALTEKSFKKYTKKGYKAIITLGVAWVFQEYRIPIHWDIEKAKDYVLKEFAKTYPTLESYEKKLNVYTKLEDFIVG